MLPASAVINIIGTIEAPFNEKIIRSDKHEINVIPDDRPSKPSIKLIAFVIPTIQPIVIAYVNIWLIGIALSKKGIFIFSILTPQATTITAAAICPDNFTNGGIFLESSIKHVIPNTIIPTKNPISFR